MLKTSIRNIVLCGVLGASSVLPSLAAAKDLPNGATTLLETYGGWGVHCAVQNGVKHCEIGRGEVNENKQPLLTMQLSLASKDVATGFIVVPFGVLVTAPVRMQVDKTNFTMEGHVRTCIPQGCIVPLSLDAAALKSLRGGKALNVKVTPAGPVPEKLTQMALNLNGFAKALDRLKTLK